MVVIIKDEFKKIAYRRVKSYLRSLYEEDFRFTTRNSLFDFVILRLNEDVLVKLVFEHEIESLYEIKKVYKSDRYKNSFFKKKFFVCYYLNDHTFQLIEI
jgi:hypothetical protein